MRNCVHIVTVVVRTSPAIPVHTLDTPTAFWAYHAFPALLTDRKSYSWIEWLGSSHKRRFEPVKTGAFVDEGFIIARLEGVDRQPIHCPECQACLSKTNPAFLKDLRTYLSAEEAFPSYSLGWGNFSCAGQQLGILCCPPALAVQVDLFHTDHHDNFAVTLLRPNVGDVEQAQHTVPVWYLRWTIKIIRACLVVNNRFRSSRGSSAHQ